MRASRGGARAQWLLVLRLVAPNEGRVDSPGRRGPRPAWEVTNTRSPQTIGEEIPSPPRRAFQAARLGGPARRQSLLARDAVSVGAAPLRPVLGRGGECERDVERDESEGCPQVLLAHPFKHRPPRSAISDRERSPWNRTYSEYILLCGGRRMADRAKLFKTGREPGGEASAAIPVPRTDRGAHPTGGQADRPGGCATVLQPTVPLARRVGPGFPLSGRAAAGRAGTEARVRHAPPSRHERSASTT